MKRKKEDILAFRIYPKPHGTEYFREDLSDEKRVEALFDYCQILEATIYKKGWDFLISHFGIEKLFEINNRSGWFDSRTVEEFERDIESEMGASP
ncbi:MAG: hypothetical protein JXA20_13935 [Spirochaetes bacterium]|nr:hypothetical protein [Spirochaetota bacterium]